MASKKSQNIFTNQTLLAQLILVAIISVGALVFENFFDTGSILNNKGRNEATLLIDFDNMKRRFEGEVVEEMTILDALNAAVAAGNIKLAYYVGNNNNTRVMEINDHLSDENKNFGFYINSKRIDANELNKTYIRAGDNIVIKLE